LRKIGDRLIFDLPAATRKRARASSSLSRHVGVCFSAVLSTLAYDLRKTTAFFAHRSHRAQGNYRKSPAARAGFHEYHLGRKDRSIPASSTLMQALATHQRWKSEVMAMTVGGEIFAMPASTSTALITSRIFRRLL